MAKDSRPWARWKRFAHRAAEAQANVLFFLLYVLIILPMGLARRRSADPLGRRTAGTPSWRPRAEAAPDLAAARRQS